MSEDLNQEGQEHLEEPIESKEEIKKDFQGLLGSTKKFLSELLDIRSNTDQEATKEAIIADIDTLRRSLKNLAVMVVLSVLTAFLFFYFFPLKTESSELLARTKPDIRDVLIAFFGGLALVIARAKKGTIASVIFGVAIATALMPSLCTVGYGLAIGNWDYAGGAMLLFGINTIFIGLATFLVLKILRFPMVRYANSQRRRLIARLVSITALAVMIPAGYIFWGVYEEFKFNRYANEFIQTNVVPYKFTKDGRFLKDLKELNYSRDETSSIELIFMGNEGVPEGVIATWKANMEAYDDLNGTELKIIQGAQSEQGNQIEMMEELYKSQKNELLSKDEKIRLLESELQRLNKLNAKQIPFQDISAEAQTNYENLEYIAFSNAIRTDFKKLDTVTVFEAKWKRNAKRADVVEDAKKLHRWLKVRLKDSTILLTEIIQD